MPELHESNRNYRINIKSIVFLSFYRGNEVEAGKNEDSGNARSSRVKQTMYIDIARREEKRSRRLSGQSQSKVASPVVRGARET